MKKIYLVAAMAAACASTGYADNTIYLYQDDEGLYQMGSLRRVSPNGKWAVGLDDSYETGSLLVNVNDPSNPVFVDGELLDVNDEGIAVGAWYDVQEASGSRVNTAHAGIYHNGWEELLEPETCIGRSWAVKISADGKYIGGHAFCQSPNEVNGSYFPVLWTYDDEYEMYLPHVYDNLPVTDHYGFFVSDMNEDGTIMVGQTYVYAGSTIPAMLKDGELVIWNKLEMRNIPFYYKGEIRGYYPSSFIDGIQEGADEDLWFNGGFLSLNGDFAYGYRSVAVEVDEDGMGKVVQYPSIYDIKNDKWTDITSGGTAVTWGFGLDQYFLIESGTSQVIIDGKSLKVDKAYNLDSPFSIGAVYGTDDSGRVLACSVMQMNAAAGGYVELPALIVLDESTTGIGSVAGDESSIKVSVNGRTINLPEGDIKVYTLDGAQVGGNGVIVQPGVYVVTDGGSNAVKVVVP